MLPNWAPNWHPLIVHFPVALLVMAVFADALALAARRVTWLPSVATAIYVVGALGAWAAFLSGRQAAEGVLIPTAANALLTDHEDWAERTVWFFALLSLVRLVVQWRRPAAPAAVRLGLLLAGLAGTFLVYQTGERGGQLVFQYGVGVAAVAAEEQGVHDHALHGGGAADSQATTAPTPGDTAMDVGHLPWFGVGWQGASPRLVHDEVAGEVLVVQPAAGGTSVTGDTSLGNMQADLRLNLGQLQGEVRLMHHLQDRENYHFLSIAPGIVGLGSVRQGQVTILDSDSCDTSGWLTARVVSDGKHFRGYVNDRLVVHGHGEEPARGFVGLRVDGRGQVLLQAFEVQALR
ncbi:MAG: DUF2231 domain-containing protein [Candidatus Latescibacterota bacterium]|jgi:uncharacterized membrane protein